jgi:hypothetical protein
VSGGVHALSWVNEATTASGPSSISRRLSRVFSLGEDVKNQENREPYGMAMKGDAHRHERAEIEPNHDEGGWCEYELIWIYIELRSRTSGQY